jgi:hypothetical protein
MKKTFENDYQTPDLEIVKLEVERGYSSSFDVGFEDPEDFEELN